MQRFIYFRENECKFPLRDDADEDKVTRKILDLIRTYGTASIRLEFAQRIADYITEEEYQDDLTGVLISSTVLPGSDLEGKAMQIGTDIFYLVISQEARCSSYPSYYCICIIRNGDEGDHSIFRREFPEEDKLVLVDDEMVTTLQPSPRGTVVNHHYHSHYYCHIQ